MLLVNLSTIADVLSRVIPNDKKMTPSLNLQSWSICKIDGNIFVRNYTMLKLSTFIGYWKSSDYF